MTQLSGDLVRHKLPTFIFGQNVVCTAQTGSTNTELKALARQGAPEGLLYLTEEQLAGRGRQGRRWHAPAGSSLLLSLLFRPGDLLPPAQSQHITMLCALALADAIHTHTDLTPVLKWPNDLVWTDGKKLAGILTEVEVEGDRLTWAIVGVGLNVNIDFKKAGLHQTDEAGNGHTPLWQTATSLSMILQRDTADLRLPILQKFLFNVEQRYNALRRGYSPYSQWRGRLAGLGQPVTIIESSGRRYEGIMTDVDQNGAVLLKQADGTVLTFVAGDVSLRL